MPFGKRAVSLEEINSFSANTLVAHLGIEFTALGEDYLEATLPVDARTKQPAGLLHGGATVALAETLASVASVLHVDLSKQSVVGLEINANHVRSMSEGKVTGRVKALHLGRTTHVWEVLVTNDDGKLVSVCRMTAAIIEKK